jgi:hypothetical protein
MPGSVGTLASTLLVEEVGGSAVSSPNVRLTEARGEFHLAKARLARDLGVGVRGVTDDILVSSMLRICFTDDTYPTLLDDVRQERVARGKKS